MRMKRQGVFITGTDTDVGKTYIGSRIARYFYQQRIEINPRKPAESGCEWVKGELQGNDSSAYFQACEQTIPLATITPFRFEAALAPPAAAQLEGETLNLEQLTEASFKDCDSGFLLVEGAGGFMSPMADDGLNADLAEKLGLPILLVAADKLGCINHILLSIEAIKTRGLKVAGVVLNRINTDQSSSSNYKWLKQNIETDIIVYDEQRQAVQALEQLKQLLIQA